MSSEERKPYRVLERGAAADLWRHTLSQIPSVFGRLVYLASLRDSNTGQYQHQGLVVAFGEKEADDTLRQSHEKSFAEWIGYSLEHQMADLDLYFSSLSTDKITLLRTWIRLSPQRNFIPALAPAVERNLYLSDLQTLLDLLKRVYGVDDPDPDA